MLIPIERLMIPPVVYLHDRKLCPDIDVPYASGRRAFGAPRPLPVNLNTGKTRLPRVLRETTTFVLHPVNIRSEGLFRIPPHSILTGALREAYDRGQMYIVWKEMGATFVEPGMDQAMVDEVRIEDAYGVHSAASLIKTWYRELRYPIFPETSYSLLRDQFASPDVEVTLEDLENILSLNSRQSPLNTTSREILLRHLLPMLSLVAECEPENKMDSNNLAICFAMTLVCGSNQLEDAKMTSVIRRILQAAIDMWPQLRQQLNIDPKSIWKDIQPPQEANEYEDPLEEPRPMRRSEDETEAHRVHLLDQDSPTGSDDLALERLPTLPPRPASGRPVSRNVSSDENPMTVPRRKPAPEPPRYSTIFADQEKAPNVAESPDGYTSADSFSHRLPSARGYSENERKASQIHNPLTLPTSMFPNERRSQPTATEVSHRVWHEAPPKQHPHISRTWQPSERTHLLL